MASFNKKPRFIDLCLAIFFAGCGILLVYYLLFHTSKISMIISTITSILSPFILGAVMAYLMCPIFNLGVRKIYAKTKGKFQTNRRALAFSKVISTIITMIVLIGIVTGFFALIIPNLIDTIGSLANTLPDSIGAISAWLDSNVKSSALLQLMINTLDTTETSFVNWAENDFLPNAGSLLSNISYGIVGLLKFSLNFLIGLILCVYFLNSKELFQAQTKEIILATFSKKRAESIFELGRRTNITFGGFINGKIIDSFIIGIICFILMSIIGLPYPVLISVIVGITNIIPFFGPFIGAIPSVLLILIVDPIQAIYFALMILALQQVDGNIIGPKILGNTTGLASFWVMFAIIVFGGLFGFAGMVIGVPIFAIVYTYLGRFFHRRLKKRDLPHETDDYMQHVKYGIADEEELRQ